MKLNFNKVISTISKFNIWTKTIILLILGFLLSHIFNDITNNTNIEGFTQSEKFVIKHGTDVYDDFYTDIYDHLIFDPVKNNFEVGQLIETTKMEPNQSIILDIGSGTGHRLKMLHDKGFNCHGLDKSKSMVAKTKSFYPDLNVQQGDALNSMIYQPESFTHINALYFTMYYIENKKNFFENCFKWLKPGGYLNIHLVNRDKFNPIINAADPLIVVSPQKYAKKRITNSLVKFHGLQYKADFKYKPEKNKAEFEETFKNDSNGNVRKNAHTFHMETQKNILAQAKDVGFILKGKLDMVLCKYEYQYIYVLYKPE